MPSLSRPPKMAPHGLTRCSQLATRSYTPTRCFSIAKNIDARKERVVILGSGWAGYGFARTLDPAKYERVIISPRSYFVFTPLLASTAVGTLEFRTILEPVRRLPGKIGFYQGWADDIDFNRKTIRVETNAAEEAASKTRVPAPFPPAPFPPPSETSGLEKEVSTPAQKPKGDVIDIPYDKLVIACGAYSQTFNIEGVREHAHFLRDIGDARRIRLRVLSLFEQCSYPRGSDHLSDADKRQLLHFAIVGGGPTGIEFAAELHDLIRDDLAPIYPDLMPLVSITVYDVAPKVLPMFDQALAGYAMDTFARQNIHVKTEHHLQRLRLADGELGRRHGALRIKIAEYGDEEVGAGLVVWSTGLMANPLVAKLASQELALDGANPYSTAPGSTTRHLLRDARTGGLLTDPYLRARTATKGSDGNSNSTSTSTSDNPTTPQPGGGSGAGGVLEDVYVIGDCAVMEHDASLPKTAQVAAQQATYLARRLNSIPAGRNGKDSVVRDATGAEAGGKPFRFRNWGTLTYLGSWKAIHQSQADELKGWVAWVVWRGAYLTKSMSWRNKLLVPVYWVISWLFGRGISRF
ncbi:pyridine nucleotide-disulfide oxidoreductase-domain-containing protein [Chaetomium fimeti]|uniref:Pyridine nucleotide-disulfide oxidoreductase-domain-containing protein n=1 Tax=Chaetomium fimeti TaxID=1854472 RepID=A0AAE0LSR7_9PEZI|nr:pyridine nucleotide-disulfide oxidoreductase-domain-containing protein [Chaetomium fimeti]